MSAFSARSSLANVRKMILLDIRRRSAFVATVSPQPSFPGLRSHRLLPIVLCLFGLFGLFGCTRSSEDRLEEVRRLQREGSIQESIPLLIELIEAGNPSGEVLYRYGRALSGLGQPARSVWALDAALDDPEWFVVASQQLALDSYRSGNLDLTIQVFERLRSENREAYESDVTALLLEARAFVETGRHYKEALERADVIIEKFPEREEAVRIKAAALLGLKRPEEAFELIRKVGVPLGEDPLDSGTNEELAGEDEPEVMMAMTARSKPSRFRRPDATPIGAASACHSNARRGTWTRRLRSPTRVS